MNTIIDIHIISKASSNDVARDVGEKGSHFTERFLKAVGPNGKGLAFEPSLTANAQPFTGH